MRNRPSVIVGALLLTSVLVVPFVVPNTGVVLHETSADYIEDENTGRRLAHLDLLLLRERGKARLEIGIKATGGRIDPVYGFQGVAGANHITGRELQALVEEGALKLWSASRAGRRVLGSVEPGRAGRVPERRLMKDGEFDLDAQSRLVYLLEVKCRSVLLAKGVSDVYVEARGIPRLHIEVEFDGERGRVTKIESLSGHDIVQ